jgi:hypothetical protein
MFFLFIYLFINSQKSDEEPLELPAAVCQNQVLSSAIVRIQNFKISSYVYGLHKPNILEFTYLFRSGSLTVHYKVCRKYFTVLCCATTSCKWYMQAYIVNVIFKNFSLQNSKILLIRLECDQTGVALLSITDNQTASILA